MKSLILPGTGLPEIMDYPQCCITIPDSPSDNPDCQEIVYLLNGYFLPFDLLIHAVDSLNSRLEQYRECHAPAVFGVMTSQSLPEILP